MKEEEFSELFPHANLKFFHIDEDGNVLYGENSNDLSDTSEPAFWDDKNAVKKLGLSKDQFITYSVNPTNFLKTLKKFNKFSPKKLKSSWQPQEWAFNEVETPPEIILKLQNINFEKFRIYVTPDKFFVFKKKLDILNFSNIQKIDFDDNKNLYCLALKAMYVLSYLGGMSIQNLKSENNLAKSLAYFYFYYHLLKFYNYRNFRQYDTSAVENEELFQSLYYWINHHVYYHSKIHYTEKELRREKDDVVRKIHRDGKWVRYQTRGGKRDISKDYLKLINNMGNGLTKTGQILFQESSQAYVYCILGAQAKTHWKIMGDGANSYQTQNIFMSLVEEITTQNNLSNLIKSMRLAIKETKVRLNFCVSPGIELLPSEMIYIKDSPGYNNILLISNSFMKFGINNNINSIEKRKEIYKQPEKSPEKSPGKSPGKSPEKSPENKPVEEVSNTSLFTTSLIIAIVLRFAWMAI